VTTTGKPEQVVLDMSDTIHRARLQRLLLARADRIFGGDLGTGHSLTFYVRDELFVAHVDESGRFLLRANLDRHLRGTRNIGRVARASEVTAEELDALIASVLAEITHHRDREQRRAGEPRPQRRPRPESPTPMPTPAPVHNERDAVIAQLNALIGLAPVKTLIAGLAHLHDFDQRRARRGLPAVAPSPHLVFTGNPGTGKTTVARLVGQLYKAVGVLPSGHVVEATRADLVAAYLGQTAIKTRELCERAVGGVLFIDEAYTLTQGHHNEYGEEAIGELLTFMENHRGQFAVIVAGYPDEMHEFLESNPGLRSRFDEVVAFPDYSDGELLDIFQSLVGQHQFTLTPEARDAVSTAIAALPRGRAFANARAVRQLFNNVVARHARGLAQRGARSDAMNVIEGWAVPHVTAEQAVPVADSGREHPGYL